MDSFPVAGNVLSEELWNGVDVREALKLIVVPILVVAYGYVLGLPTAIYLGVALLLSSVTGLAILIAPGSQSSFEYLKASLDYYFTRNAHYKRHARPDHAEGMKIKDESLVHQEYESEMDLLVASQQGELLDDQE